MSTREHEQYRENVGAYLLGALPELEAEVFERHLETCRECRDEVEELRVAAEALPRSVEPLEPSPELRSSLMEIVWREAKEERQPVRERRRLRFPALPRLSPALAGVSAAVLLALGVAVGLGIGGVTGDDERTIAAQVDIPRASGSLVIDEGDDDAVLRLQGMPQPPAGQVMQVWLQRGDDIVPSTVFAVRADGTAAAAIPGDLGDVSRVMATREPAGGSRAPSQLPPPVVVEL
jgi:anti-sigma-K factor RskA